MPDYEFGKPSTGGTAGDASAGSGGVDAGGGTTGGGTGGVAGGAAGGSGSAGAAGAGGTPPRCSGDQDCAATPSTPKCNVASGVCAPCLPTDDVCIPGLYCAASGNSFQCKPGCKVGGSECSGSLGCDPTLHQCLGCTQDDDCPAGQVCETATTACIPGCTPAHACPSGFSCCSGSCVALAIDVDNCGDCGNVCPTPANGKRSCVQAKCGVECTIAFTQNCNGLIPDGCEVDVKTNAEHCGSCGSPCTPGQSCIDGKCT